ncbi:hypothetical protein ACGFX4_18490 [Kitasatospora sp. NPDC048365]|uniref:hypothetical protein n=1 Tax=Kitasatospora sp. NPDC048365 TaxID=3364050 RepID=UPI00371679F8
MAAVTVALAALCAVGGAGTAEAVPTPEHHCVSEGVDLNAYLGISERIIGPPGCREALAGERWVRFAPPWGTAPSAQGTVYPAGYTPSRPAPMDDFLAKFQGIRVVQDIGTPREWSAVTGPEAVRRLDNVEGLTFAFFASNPLRPLSVGRHTTTVFMRLSAEHCDGVSTDPDASCLPAGEFPWTGDAPLTFFPRRP